MGDAAQLALAVHLRDDATFDNFLFAETDQALRDALEGQLGEGGEPFIYLHGSPGAGRSHLLQAACHKAPNGAALYLPLEQLADRLAAEVLAGVEALQLVVLDDLQVVAGHRAWEEALFHLINRAREGGCRLLVSADCAPRQLAVNLADLQSRLGGGLVFRLRGMGHEEKLQWLRFRARRRGMNLTEAAAKLMLDRAQRSPEQLLDLLDRLDRASMEAQRSLTRDFVREALKW